MQGHEHRGLVSRSVPSCRFTELSEYYWNINRNDNTLSKHLNHKVNTLKQHCIKTTEGKEQNLEVQFE